MFIFIVGQIIGCKPTRWVEKDDYLLQRNKIELEHNQVNKKELESFYRQEPNKRFLLIFKFHLAAYNFSKLGEERKWKSWIRRVIGEEPAVFDSVLVERTKNQFEKYLMNEAYYNAEVDYELTRKRKRAWVNYYVKPGKPVIINEVYYQINDTSLTHIVYSDTMSSHLLNSERMTIHSLEKERSRIVKQLRDSGYFEFNSEFISYKIDTVFNKADITIVLNNILKKDSLNNISEFSHRKFWINNVYFLPDFDPKKAIKNRKGYFQTFDTTEYKGFGFIYPGKPNVRPKVILKANTVRQGDLYNYTHVNSTLRYLNSLKLFRLNNLNFYYEPGIDSLINCVVQLTPSVYQNYSINFETTKSTGNIGIGGNVSYQHRNLFRGAEILNLKVSGSLQRQTETESTAAFNIYEYGAEASLETPSFILPFRMDRFYKKFNPKTNFSVSYNYQERPDYIRTFSNGSMGYDWKGEKSIRHFVSPIDIGYVYVEGQASYIDSIRRTVVGNNFRDYLITGGNYSMFYQNKAKKAFRSFHYFRWNVGTAGNMLHFAHNKLGLKQIESEGYYAMFNMQYAQYILTNIDYRYNYFINKDNSLITRFYGGIAKPYGNSNAIPFVKQYFSGGAEGIRAWHPRNLGPGSYVVPDSIQSRNDYYPNQMADIKLEFNLEYRYSLNSNWKGALFLDVGNIWSISSSDEREGAVFSFDNFYEQLAVGTGFGIRYDLEFAVFRIDWGIKVRDPSIQGVDSWVLIKTPFTTDDLVWHVAVGYPF